MPNGKVSAKVAATYARSEFEKSRVTQDQLYKSDVDHFRDAAKVLTNGLAEDGQDSRPTGHDPE